MIFFAYYNKLTSIYLIKIGEEEGESKRYIKNDKFMVDINNKDTKALEKINNENINRILKNKQAYLQRKDFEIFSNTKYEEKDEVKK